MEKTKRVSNKRYMMRFVEGMNGGILKTAEVYDLLTELDAEFGYKQGGWYSPVLREVVESLGDSVTVEYDPTTKRRGRGKSMLYCVDSAKALKIINALEDTAATTKEEDLAKDEIKDDEIRVIKPAVSRPLKRRRGVNGATASSVTSAGLPALMVHQRKKRNEKEVIVNLYKALETAYDRNQYVVKVDPKEMDILLLKKGLDNVISGDWNKSISSIIFKSKDQIKRDLVTLDSYIEEKYGERMGACAKFHLTKKVSSPDKKEEDTLMLVAFTTYKILSRTSGPVEIPSLLKTFRDRLGISKNRGEFLEIVKSLEGLALSKDKTCASLVPGFDIAAALDKYNPKRAKEVIFARIGLTPDRVDQLYPMASWVSKITEEDYIYKLTVDKSFECQEKLLKLYRTFRGTDCILGREDIVSELDRQIKLADLAYRNSSYLYMLEKE